MNNKYRVPGHYWVRLHNKWMVAEYVSEKWLIPGREYQYSDTQFDTIYEDRITLPFCARNVD